MNNLSHEPIVYRCQTIAGQNRGAGLGFPTINLIIPNNFPYDHGIYGGFVTIGDTASKAAIHYGPIPAFNDPKQSLEAHVINAHIGDRPEEIGIQLLFKIREIEDFKSTVALKKQIKTDVEEIKSRFTD